MITDERKNELIEIYNSGDLAKFYVDVVMEVQTGKIFYNDLHALLITLRCQRMDKDYFGISFRAKEAERLDYLISCLEKEETFLLTFKTSP